MAGDSLIFGECWRQVGQQRLSSHKEAHFWCSPPFPLANIRSSVYHFLGRINGPEEHLLSGCQQSQAFKILKSLQNIWPVLSLLNHNRSFCFMFSIFKMKSILISLNMQWFEDPGRFRFIWNKRFYSQRSCNHSFPSTVAYSMPHSFSAAPAELPRCRPINK